MAADVPKITAYLLNRGLDMCPRRLLFEYEERAKTADAFNRWRVRTPLVDCASVAHATLRKPEAADFPLPPGLVVEEERVFARAVDGYVARFGATAAIDRTDAALSQPTISHARNVRLAGGVDLLVETAAGDLELRQLELWSRPLCADPRLDFTAAVAVLRLARFATDRCMRIVHADLLSGEADAFEFDYRADLDAVRRLFDERLDAVRSRMHKLAVRPGTDCGSCGYIAGCPPHAAAAGAA